MEQIGRAPIPLTSAPASGQSSDSCSSLRLFLSYGHDDNSVLVRRIKEDIERLGHEVWLDLSDIKSGDDWRRAITDGITNSNLMFCFLSRHSTRDPGVCLDELSIALAVKGAIVQTVLVENEQEVTVPVSLSHIQWLDMHDWREHWDTATRAPRADGWYDQKLSEIFRILESDISCSFAGEVEELRSKLNPISNETRIGFLLRAFEGRHWLARDINEWRQHNLSSRVFFLTGEPGVGKSAFAAWLAHHNRVNVIAAHFIEYNKPEHSRASRIIMSIAFQIASRLPDYRKFLLRLPEIDRINDQNAAEAFDTLLVEPLSLVVDGNRERYVVLIDALDEASETSSNSLVDLLAREGQRLPNWITFVVTSRPDPSILRRLSHLQPVELKADEKRNRSDLAEFVRKWLEGRNLRDADPVWLVEKIVSAAEGNFLYLRHFCDAVEKPGWIDLLAPESYPKGMTGMYLEYFRRQFPDIKGYETLQMPLLQLVVAAFEPLPEKLVQQILGMGKMDRDWVKVLDSLGSLFQRQDGRITPFHKSMNDWLTNPDDSGADYYVPSAPGHELLAEFGWSHYLEGTLHPYFSSYLPSHLMEVGRFSDLLRLLSDLQFLSSAWGKDPLSVLRHWMFLENEGHGRLIEATAAVGADPANFPEDMVCNIAEILRDASYPEEELALRIYLLEATKGRDDVPLRIRSLINLGKNLRHLGQNKAAIDRYAEAQNLAKESGNEHLLATSYLEIGDIYRHLGKYGNAEEILEPAVELFATKRNWTEFVKAALKLELVYAEESRYRESINLGVKYLELARADGNRETEAYLHLLLCRAYASVKDLDASTRHMEAGLQIVQALPNLHSDKDLLCLTGKFLLRKANISRLKSDFVSGLRLDQEAYSVFKEIGDFRLMGTALLRQAGYYRQKWDLPRYQELLEQQLIVARRTGNVSQIKSSMHNVAFAHQLKGEYDEALKRYRECLEFSMGPGFKSASTRGNMADICRFLGKFEEAIGLYEGLLYEATADRSSNRVARCQRYLSLTHFLKGDLAVAKQYAAHYRAYATEKHKSHSTPPNAFAYFLVHDALMCAEEGNATEGGRVITEVLKLYPDFLQSEDHDLVDASINLARYYLFVGEIDKADRILSESKRYWERYQRERSFAWHKLTTAAVRHLQGREVEALETASVSHALFAKFNLCRQAESALLLSRIYLKKGDLGQSDSFLLHAETCFKRYGQLHKVAEASVIRGMLTAAEGGDARTTLALVGDACHTLSSMGWGRLARWAGEAKSEIAENYLSH